RSELPTLHDEESQEDRGGAPLELPHLTAASAGAAVVIVGGTIKNEKLERLRQRTGLQIEWVPVEHGSGHAVGALERRIREGRLCGLIILQDLIAHKYSEPLLHAAREAELSWAYGGKAGTAVLDKALRDLDAALAQRSQSPASVTTNGR